MEVEGELEGEVEGGVEGVQEWRMENVCVFSSRGCHPGHTKEGILRRSSTRNSKNSQRL